MRRGATFNLGNSVNLIAADMTRGYYIIDITDIGTPTTS